MARIGRISLQAAVVAAVLVTVGVLAPAFTVDPPPVHLVVDGAPRQVAAGSTLADAAVALGLHPRSGDLVDVSGATLRAGVYPGTVLVDGAPVPDAQPLHDHDRIALVPGPDRTEPVTVRRVPVPGGLPADPELTLGRTPGVDVTARGKLSGKVASTDFEPTGPTVVPHAVALTFDDGPWPGQTLAILAILRRLHVPATFFLIGEQAQRYPALVRAEQRRPDVLVEDHSWSHPLTPPFGEQRPGVVRDQIGRARAVLAADGVQPTLFRPPGGGWSDHVVSIASSLGCRVVLWSVDPRDWAPGATAKGITRSVLRAVHPGSIVLMHDGGGDRSPTIRALPRIIHGIRHRGLRLVTVEP